MASEKLVFGCEHGSHNKTCKRSLWEGKPLQSRFLGMCRCTCHKKDVREAIMGALKATAPWFEPRTAEDEMKLHERMTI